MAGTYNFQFSLLAKCDQHPPSHCSKIVNLLVIPGPTVLCNHACWMLHLPTTRCDQYPQPPIAHLCPIKLMKKMCCMQLSDWSGKRFRIIVPVLKSLNIACSLCWAPFCFMIDSRVKKGKAQVEKETRVLGRYELVEAVMETRTGPRPSIISFLMVHHHSIGDCSRPH